MSEIPDHVRRAVLTVAWVIIGVVLAKSVIDLQPMPGFRDLREVRGTVVALEADSRSGRGGSSYWLYVTMQGDATRYRLDDERAGGPAHYFRIRNTLRRGDQLTLWAENHAAHGQRIWQIQRGGDKLLDYLTVFDADWASRLMLYGLIAGYAALSAGGFFYLRRQRLQTDTNQSVP